MSKAESSVAELYVISFTCDFKRYSKDLTYENVEQCLKIDPFNKTYDEYIEPTLLYFAEDSNKLAKALCVDRIVPKGLYIMGIYGGEKKKGAEEYAGLVLQQFRRKNNEFILQLYNTRKTLEVPERVLRDYGVGVFETVYVGEINPFKLQRLLPVILSNGGEKSMKEFLKYIVKAFERDLPKEDINKINALAEELKQPDKIEVLNQKKYYVLYRGDRAFSATVFVPNSDKCIVESHVGYVEVNDESIAYYYAALLNYLAYKVVESGKSFNRHQFARPLQALYVAGLSWHNVDEATRLKIVELSKKLHEKAPLKKYGNQSVALKEISTYPEFRELKEILDKIIDKRRLEKMLGLVSG